MNGSTYQQKIKDLNTERKHVQAQIKKGGRCIICGYDRDPTIIELHHIAGRKNSDVVIPVCPICHRYLSMGQEPKKVERGRSNKTNLEKLAWDLEGTADVLKMVASNLREKSLTILGDGNNG